MKTVVVLGPDEVAKAVRTSAQFTVLHATASSGFRDLVQGPLKGVEKSDLVYLIADNLTMDTGSLTVDRLVERMSTSDYHVIVLGYGAGADDLVEAYPSAGLLRGPFDTNTLLAAIAGLTRWDVQPHEASGVVLSDDTFPTAPAAGGFPAFDADLGVETVMDDVPSLTNEFPVQVDASTDFGSFPPLPGAGSDVEFPTEVGVGVGGGFGAIPQPVPAFEPVLDAPTARDDIAPQPQNSGFGPAPAMDSSGFGPIPETGGAGFGPSPATADFSGFGPAPSQPTTTTDFPPFAASEPYDAAPTPLNGFSPPSNLGFGPSTESPFSSFTPPPAVATTSPVSPNPMGSGFGPAMPVPSRDSGYGVSSGGLGGRKSTVVAVAAPKGGVGKTTLTINLAVFAGLRLQSQGKRVAVIDANYQQADIGKILGQYEPTLNDVAKDPAYQTASQIQRFMCTSFRHYNVDVLLGPNTPQESNPVWITPRLYNTVVNACRELYDVIFVDCPVAEPHHELFEEFILPQADYLVMPVNPSFATLSNAKLWLNYLGSDPTSGVAYDVNKVGIVLNQAQENVDVDSETVRRELPRWKFLAELKSSREWIRASNNNEIVAASNFADVNAAFSQVMWDITRYDVFNTESGGLVTPAGRGFKKSGSGLFSKLFGGAKR